MRAANGDDEDTSAADDAAQWAARIGDGRADREGVRYATREGVDERPELFSARSGESDDEGESTDEADPNELSVDSLPSELATGRAGVDELLESMFTERTQDTARANDETHREDGVQTACEADADDEQGHWQLETERLEDELGLLADQDNDGEQGVTLKRGRGEEPSLMGYADEQDPPDTRDGEQHVDLPVTMGGELQLSVLIEAKPHNDKPASGASSPMAQCSPAQASHAQQPLPSVHPSAARIIAFDVGGKLFRCKESLIRKHPLKRLNQVISCGCERIGHDTFFIDRNPQHFEVILDWYRTGTYVRHPHVSERALQEDAKYFDLFDELFSDKVQQQSVPEVKPIHNNSVPIVKPPPRIPPRLHRQESSQPQAHAVKPAHTSTQQRHSESRSDNNKSDNNLDTVRFYKTEHSRIEADGVPVVFMVRRHEHLLVASVEGRGKLLVRVCDATGLRSVQVPSAVLFDSQSCFYLQGGRVELRNCLLPGGHTYTFWMEVDCGTANSAAKRELDVEFKLLSTFQSEEQLTDALDEELQILTSGALVAGAFSEAQPTSSSASTSTFSPYMFLPPGCDEQRPSYPVHRLQTSDPGPNQRGSEFAPMLRNGNDRDAVAQQLFLQSNASPTHNDAVSNPQSKAKVSALSPSRKPGKATAGSLASPQTKAQTSTLKRNGAAIIAAEGSKASSTTSRQAGRITIYRHAQLKVEQTPRESQAPSPRDERVRSQKQKEGGVTAKYQEHQPRLFR
ncbi:hypothetical protein Gpo141_00002012 [Globisporangium polare]